jgi:hypothetical protein
MADKDFNIQISVDGADNATRDLERVADASGEVKAAETAKEHEKVLEKIPEHLKDINMGADDVAKAYERIADKVKFLGENGLGTKILAHAGDLKKLAGPLTAIVATAAVAQRAVGGLLDKFKEIDKEAHDEFLASNPLIKLIADPAGAAKEVLSELGDVLKGQVLSGLNAVTGGAFTAIDKLAESKQLGKDLAERYEEMKKKAESYKKEAASKAVTETIQSENYELQRQLDMIDRRYQLTKAQRELEGIKAEIADKQDARRGDDSQAIESDRILRDAENKIKDLAQAVSQKAETIQKLEDAYASQIAMANAYRDQTDEQGRKQFEESFEAAKKLDAEIADQRADLDLMRQQFEIQKEGILAQAKEQFVELKDEISDAFADQKSEAAETVRGDALEAISAIESAAAASGQEVSKAAQAGIKTLRDLLSDFTPDEEQAHLIRDAINGLRTTYEGSQSAAAKALEESAKSADSQFKTMRELFAHNQALLARTEQLEREVRAANSRFATPMPTR